MKARVHRTIYISAGSTGSIFSAFILGVGSAQLPAQNASPAGHSLPPMPPAPKISVQHGAAATNQISRRSIPIRAVSPVAYFRELLAMKPAEREKALADRTAEQKQNVLAKIKEYEAMSPEERELRLKMTEVRWHLVPLMKMSPVERTPRLAGVPAADRELIERRLKIWDTVPIELQKEFLKNEAVIDQILRIEATTPEQREKLLDTFPPGQRQKVEQGLAQWRELPVDQRQQMCDRFKQFFELNSAEREKTLGTLPAAERQQTAKTLQGFEKLPPEERKRCIEAFRKFAGMSLEERDQFLRNAERWQAMTPAEREAWREIVQKMPPMPPPVPPAIANFPPTPSRMLAVTNSPK